jgi:hypothetical protein
MPSSRSLPGGSRTLYPFPGTTHHGDEEASYGQGPDRLRHRVWADRADRSRARAGVAGIGARGEPDARRPPAARHQRREVRRDRGRCLGPRRTASALHRAVRAGARRSPERGALRVRLGLRRHGQSGARGRACRGRVSRALPRRRRLAPVARALVRGRTALHPLPALGAVDDEDDQLPDRRADGYLARPRLHRLAGGGGAGSRVRPAAAGRDAPPHAAATAGGPRSDLDELC